MGYLLYQLVHDFFHFYSTVGIYGNLCSSTSTYTYKPKKYPLVPVQKTHSSHICEFSPANPGFPAVAQVGDFFGHLSKNQFVKRPILWWYEICGLSKLFNGLNSQDHFFANSQQNLKHVPLNIERNSLEVDGRQSSFLFMGGGCRFQPLIFQHVKHLSKCYQPKFSEAKRSQEDIL